jgi:lysozyme family protein
MNDPADRFWPCNTFTLTAEGGLVDNPEDPGGLTNQGLTMADMTRWVSHATPDDLRKLPNDARDAIYRALYWQPIRGWSLWPGLDLMIYDHGVNRGHWPAVSILQGLLRVDVDGDLGPLTANAARAVPFSQRAELLTNLGAAYKADYSGLAQFDTFGRGWLARNTARLGAAVAMLPPVSS